MRWRLAALATAAALAGISACAGQAEPQPPPPRQPAERLAPSTDATASPIEVEPDWNTPAAPIPGASSGGTLTVYSKGVPETFDPTAVYYTDSSAILTLVTRALTQYRYDEEAGEMELVPDLATDLGRPNADFTEWTFTLRDGITYEDGTEVTADDIAYAVKRQFARAEISGGPTYGIDYFLEGDTYQGPFRDGPEFAGVETPDEKTIVLTMRRPFADLPYFASFPAFTPIPEGRDGPEEYAERPLATGPYRFAEYEPGHRLVLEQNPRWDPETDTTRHQYIDRFVFRFGQDERASQQRVLADRGADRQAIAVDAVLDEIYTELQGTEDEQRIAKGRGSCTDFAFLDTTAIPLEVRRALQVAWPIESEVMAAGKVPGLTWSPATSIMPSITPGWAPFDVVGNQGQGDGDPERAREMLEEAGHEDFELAFAYVSGDPLEEAVAAAREAGLTAAGFDVTTVPVPEAQLRGYSADPDSPIDIRFFGWCTDWPSGGAVFPALFDGRKIAPESITSNPSRLDEEEVNREIDRISALPPEEGVAAWGELDRLILEEYAPVVVLGESDVAMLHGSKVGNVEIDAVNNLPYYVGMYLIP